MTLVAIILILTITIQGIILMLTLDDLKTAVATNTTLTAQIIAAKAPVTVAAPPDAADINTLTQQVQANNEAIQNALTPPPATPPQV